MHPTIMIKFDFDIIMDQRSNSSNLIEEQELIIHIFLICYNNTFINMFGSFFLVFE